MQSESVEMIVVDLKENTLHVKNAKIEIDSAWDSLNKVFSRSEIESAKLGFIIGALSSHHNIMSK